MPSISHLDMAHGDVSSFKQLLKAMAPFKELLEAVIAHPIAQELEQLDVLRSDCDGLRTQCDELQTKCDELQALKAEHEERICQLQTENCDLLPLRSQIDMMQAEVEELYQLRFKNIELGTLCEELRPQCDALKAEREKLCQLRTEICSEIGEVQAYVERLNIENINLQAESCRLKAQNEELQAESCRLNEQIDCTAQKLPAHPAPNKPTPDLEPKNAPSNPMRSMHSGIKRRAVINAKLSKEYIVSTRKEHFDAGAVNATLSTNAPNSMVEAIQCFDEAHFDGQIPQHWPIHFL